MGLEGLGEEEREVKEEEDLEGRGLEGMGEEEGEG